MSYRYMRLIVFFDLPSVSNYDKKQYRQFRKFLIKEGFIMMQESVYCKLLLNNSALKSQVSRVRKHKPLTGSVVLLSVTEKQYASAEYLVGQRQSSVLDSDERLIVL